MILARGKRIYGKCFGSLSSILAMFAFPLYYLRFHAQGLPLMENTRDRWRRKILYLVGGTNNGRGCCFTLIAFFLFGCFLCCWRWFVNRCHGKIISIRTFFSLYCCYNLYYVFFVWCERYAREHTNGKQLWVTITLLERMLYDIEYTTGTFYRTLKVVVGDLRDDRRQFRKIDFMCVSKMWYSNF